MCFCSFALSQDFLFFFFLYDYDSWFSLSTILNQSKWACTGRKAVRDFEQNVALESKKNPKTFFSYTKSKLTTKSRVSDLVDKDGNAAHTDRGRTRMLNGYFLFCFHMKKHRMWLGCFFVFCFLFFCCCFFGGAHFEERHCESALGASEIAQQIVNKKLSRLDPNKATDADTIPPCAQRICRWGRGC